MVVVNGVAGDICAGGCVNSVVRIVMHDILSDRRRIKVYADRIAEDVVAGDQRSLAGISEDAGVGRVGDGVPADRQGR